MRQTVAASVIAAAALAGPASAQDAQASSCTLQEAGLPLTLNQYAGTAAACLQAPPAGVAVRADLEADALAALNAARRDAGLQPLEARSAFSEAARLHAIDMAARGYAAHVDPEGRGHLSRIRALDRTGLIGSAGGNVSVLRAGSPDALAASLTRDGVDRENVLRPEFTDAGIGVVEAGGQTFAVAVFARVDGELDAPLPLDGMTVAQVHTDLDRDAWRVAGLRLASADGATLDQSLAPTQIRVPADGYLEVLVDEGDGVLHLRGPAVAAR